MGFWTGGQGACARVNSRPEKQSHKRKGVLLHPFYRGEADLEQGCDVFQCAPFNLQS